MLFGRELVCGETCHSFSSLEAKKDHWLLKSVTFSLFPAVWWTCLKFDLRSVVRPCAIDCCVTVANSSGFSLARSRYFAKFSDKHPCAEIVWYPVNVAQESEQTFENISVNAFTSRVCIVSRIQSFIVWQQSRLNSWRLELLTAAFDTIKQGPSFHSNWRNRNPSIHKQIHFRDRPGVYLLLLNSTSWIPACLFYRMKLCF